MAATDNSKLFDNGMKKAQTIIYLHLYQELCDLCDQLVLWPPKVDHRGWHNLTGNTVTSYACGLYMRGTLVYMAFAADGMKSPTRVKLTKGQYYYREVDGQDYDGRFRDWGPAPIDTDAEYGRDTSMKFLQNYASATKKGGFEIVMCTGTEYSTYIENVRHGDVLTGTFERATRELATHIKPMKS